MSWIAAVASSLLLMLAMAAPAAAAGSAPSPPAPSATPPPTPLCALAAQLTEDAKPQQAVQLIEDARDELGDADLCPLEHDAATQAEAGATALIGRASALASASGPDWEAVRARIEAAQQLDEDVDDPDGVIKEAAQHKAAAPERLSRTWLEQASKSWGDFTDKYLVPLGKYLLAAAAASALIVALARLVILLPLSTRLFSGSSLRSRLLANIADVLSLVASGLIIAYVLPGAVSATAVDEASLAGLALLALATTALTAYSLATRLRLTITVAGKSDDSGATEVVALLREIGADKPRGLEVPRGSDVDILDGKAIADAPTGVLAAALKVLQAVLGFAPWVVVVDDREGETFTVVTRNGRSWDSAVIKKQPFGKDGPTVDTRKMAAAFILVAVSRGYAPSDFEGLAGTTDWRALGWQYVATTDKSLEHEDRLWLLNDAVDVDPRSALAQLAFHHELYRNANTPEPLKAYANWLRDYPHQDQLPWSIRLRMAYNRLVAEVNHRAAVAFAAADVDRAPADDAIRQAAKALQARLDEEPDQDLTIGMRAAARPILEYAGVQLAVEETPLASPTEVYNAICGDAVVKGPWVELVDQLAVNLQTSEAVDWAWHDPMLKRVTALPEFRAQFAKAPPTMLESRPFKTHADPLRDADLDAPEALVAPGMTTARLATLLDVREPVAGLLQQAARFAVLVDDDLAGHRFLIIETLAAAGIANPDDLKETALTRAELADRVFEAADKKGCKHPDRDDLLDWLMFMTA